MDKKFSEQLLRQLKVQIAGVRASESDPFKVLTSVLKLVREARRKLQERLLKQPLKDLAEQIQFYKVISPSVECLRVFELELYNVVSSVPAGDEEARRAFYRSELGVVARFFKQVAFHYQYYKLGATELDELLFVPGKEVESVLVPEAPDLGLDLDLNSSVSSSMPLLTAGSYLFAKMMAFEALQGYLEAKLSGADVVSADSLAEQLKHMPRWTGEQVNLVELAYGIYYTRQLNDGQVEVKDVLEMLELVFKIKLNSAYHVFGNIRRRKMYSPTRFLDKMREAIQQRVDDDLSLHPKKTHLR